MEFPPERLKFHKDAATAWVSAFEAQNTDKEISPNITSIFDPGMIGPRIAGVLPAAEGVVTGFAEA